MRLRSTPVGMGAVSVARSSSPLVRLASLGLRRVRWLVVRCGCRIRQGCRGWQFSARERWGWFSNAGGGEV